MSGKLSPRQRRHGAILDEFIYHSHTRVILGEYPDGDEPVLEVHVSRALGPQARALGDELDALVRDLAKRHGGRVR